MQVVALAVYGVSRSGASQVSRSGGVRRRLSRAAGSPCISEDAVQPARIPQDTAPGVAAVVRVSRCGGWRRRVSLPAGSPCIPEDPVHPARIQRDVAPLSPPYRRWRRRASTRAEQAGGQVRTRPCAAGDARIRNPPRNGRSRRVPSRRTGSTVEWWIPACGARGAGAPAHRTPAPQRDRAAGQQGAQQCAVARRRSASGSATGQQLQLLDLHGDV